VHARGRFGRITIGPQVAAAEDKEIYELLRDAFPGQQVATCERRAAHRSSSFALEEIVVRFSDGSSQILVFKDLAWERLHDYASSIRPAGVFDPAREIETYRCILAPREIGPHYRASVIDPAANRYWLFIDRVDGRPLRYHGEIATWARAVEWLAWFHATLAPTTATLRDLNPHLLAYDDEWFDRWRRRAYDVLARSDDARAVDVMHVLRRSDALYESLAALPRTLMHGEFYGGNIIIDEHGPAPAVRPVDWEVAAVGSGLFDLAAVTAGFPWRERIQRFREYRAALMRFQSQTPNGDHMRADLDRARFHMSVQWIGWRPDGAPPPMPDRRKGRPPMDWLAEAWHAARRLEL
jgi:aminoglycoside phosphotransferase (APT) family kinase protein